LDAESKIIELKTAMQRFLQWFFCQKSPVLKLHF
jgi:hypothetical protein